MRVTEVGGSRTARSHPWIEKALRWVFPRPCLGCDRLVEEGTGSLSLCARCRGKLLRLRGPRCPGCARALRGYRIPADYRCGRCRLSPPTYDRLIARWQFAPPLDAVIHGLKFERLDFLGRALGRELAGCLAATSLQVDCVTWVPLHWRRHLQRGYNQAEIIARSLSRCLDLPTRRLLTRHRATATQTGLSRSDRRRNLTGAMRPRYRLQLASGHVLVVDDVFTTGSTLEAAATSLKAAGAGEITVATAARTPDPGEIRRQKTVIW